ncbi:MAG: GntR family transcriptional regulator [Alphaproteobacteria bacterium]|nr:GntR family transcriptional regulator [Alphaproteobacteria bacterium]
MTTSKNQTRHPLELVTQTQAELSDRPIQRPTGLVEEVYARVRAEIMSLAIPPDTRVTIESLARRLGVSQTPVREALSMLEAKGLVTKQQFIGYCTAPILNRAQFEEIYEIRLLLEPYAARRAAEKMSDEQIAELQRLLARMAPDGDATRSSYDRFAEQDSDLHERIAIAGGNRLIAESLARMHIHLHIFRLCFKSRIASDAHDEHAGLVAAIAARDGAGAEEAMRAHLRNSHARFSQFAQP